MSGAQLMYSLIAAASEGAHAAAAHGAEHGGEHQIDWFVVGSMITNAVLFFGFLAIKLKPDLLKFLGERRSNMAVRLDDAQKKTAEAERRLREYGHKLDHLEEEVERIVRSYEAEGNADKERMKAETDKAIERIQREADFTIKQELRKAEKAIKASAIDATLELAEKMVKNKITDADRKTLAEKYIKDLENGANGAH